MHALDWGDVMMGFSKGARVTASSLAHFTGLSDLDGGITPCWRLGCRVDVCGSVLGDGGEGGGGISSGVAVPTAVPKGAKKESGPIDDPWEKPKTQGSVQSGRLIRRDGGSQSLVWR